jgi:pantetheine-phosphate adenylyltransferase
MRTLGIVPGTFDPPTLGHLDVIERASKLFDEIIVAVGVNSSKRPLLTTPQRVEALERSSAHLSNVRVEAFEGLLVDYVAQKGAKSIVRGLRAIADFEYEFQMALVNRRLNSAIDTVFLMTNWEHSYLSSSIVREVAQLRGNFSEFVHPEVAKIITDVLEA